MNALTDIGGRGEEDIKDLEYGIEFSDSLNGCLKGRSPFKTYTSPSPLEERGIKGVR